MSFYFTVLSNFLNIKTGIFILRKNQQKYFQGRKRETTVLVEVTFP